MYQQAISHSYPPNIDWYQKASTGLRWRTAMVVSNRFSSTPICYGWDPARIAVIGHNFGGGLAAASSLLALDRQLKPAFSMQILIQPIMDDRIMEKQRLDGLTVVSFANTKTSWDVPWRSCHGYRMCFAICSCCLNTGCVRHIESRILRLERLMHSASKLLNPHDGQ